MGNRPCYFRCHPNFRCGRKLPRSPQFLPFVSCNRPHPLCQRNTACTLNYRLKKWILMLGRVLVSLRKRKAAMELKVSIMRKNLQESSSLIEHDTASDLAHDDKRTANLGYPVSLNLNKLESQPSKLKKELEKLPPSAEDEFSTIAGVEAWLSWHWVMRMVLTYSLRICHYQ